MQQGCDVCTVSIKKVNICNYNYTVITNYRTVRLQSFCNCNYASITINIQWHIQNHQQHT